MVTHGYLSRESPVEMTAEQLLFCFRKLSGDKKKMLFAQSLYCNAVGENSSRYDDVIGGESPTDRNCRTLSSAFTAADARNGSRTPQLTSPALSRDFALLATSSVDSRTSFAHGKKYTTVLFS